MTGIGTVASAVRTTTITTARIHQAVTSSTAAAAIVTDPRCVFSIPRSVSIRASTGKAVTLMAAPRKSANAVKLTLSSERRGYRNSARHAPRKNGAMMLA